ncbi:MAG: hypothetical protein JW754_03005 [Candidatus Aenigmarchaeota archaeon]|nr:hypothetical protein [Candidatus Aenigmarchaeota archaeon]
MAGTPDIGGIRLSVMLEAKAKSEYIDWAMEKYGWNYKKAEKEYEKETYYDPTDNSTS